MARNRVIYQSEALFAAPTGTSTLTAASHGVRRIQSCNYNLAIQRQDINQYGELAAIDRLIIQEPTVTVDMSYYFEPTGFNETALGLRMNTYTNEAAATGVSTISDHALDYIISSGANYDQKNIFIMVSDPGIDANDTSAVGMQVSGNWNGIIGIGNAFLTSWSLDAAVGAIPTVSCAFEGQNIVFTGWGSAGLPAINAIAPNPSVVNGVDPGLAVTFPSGAGSFSSATEVSAVRPGDITVVLTAANDNAPVIGFDETDLKIQSVNFGMTVGREPIRKLGSLFAFAREITFPINCTMSINAVVGDTVGSRLFTLLSSDTSYNCAIKLVGKLGGTSDRTAYIVLKNAKIDSQNITSSIGPNKALTLELSAQIGRSSGLHLYGRAAT